MKTNAEIINKVVAEQLGLKESEIKPTDSLLDDLGADSLDVVELVMSIEDEFDVEIDDSDAEGIETIQDINDLIVKLQRRG